MSRCWSASIAERVATLQTKNSCRGSPIAKRVEI